MQLLFITSLLPNILQFLTWLGYGNILLLCYFCNRKMKQITLILLIGLYAMSSLGVGFAGFFCCGKLESVSLAFAKESKAKCVKGDSADSCCKTVYASFKINDNHFASEIITSVNHQFAAVTTNSNSHPSVTFFSYKTNTINGSHAPPLINNVPLYLSNCVFII